MGDYYMTIKPLAEPVSLDECPVGLFLFNGTLAVKTEYCTTSRYIAIRQVDAYIVESGEYFWGGVSTPTERAALMVTPCEVGRVGGLTTMSEPVRRLEGCEALVQEAWQRVRDASAWMEETAADPKASQDDKFGTRMAYETATRQFGRLWREIDYLLSKEDVKP